MSILELANIMNHDLGNSIALLTRTPAVLDALLRGLPDEWTLRNEGEHTWNASGIVGHLIHCERTDWMPRAKWLLKFESPAPSSRSTAGDMSAKTKASRWLSCSMNLRHYAQKILWNSAP